jgi:competence protein ComEC
VVPYLRGEGVKKLDAFVVSHKDEDHSGGAFSVLAQVPVGWLASSFDLPETAEPVKRIKCFAGQHWRWDDVNFEVLYPRIESYESVEIKDNNRSCVVKVTSQFGSELLTGDIEKEAERVLIEHALRTNTHKASGDINLSNNSLASDVLITPHHGSKTSSMPEFIEAVSAKYTIFTVGYLNCFKHPNPLIENRYKGSSAAFYRSDYQGALLLDFTQKSGIKINAWRQSESRYWQDGYESDKN